MQRGLLILWFTLLAGYAVLRMLNEPVISPDSTIYITAADNMLRTGDMFTWVNFPSLSMAAEREVITDYPPGLPLYYSAFMRFIDDPLHAAYAGQTVAIIAFFAALYALCHALAFTPVMSGLVAGFIAFSVPFGIISRALLTETLFIALSIGVLVCAIAWQKTRRNGFLYAAWVMLVLSGFIRLPGLANIVPLLVVLWSSKERKVWRIFTTVLLGVLPQLAWFARNLLLYGVTTQSHKVGQQFYAGNIEVPFYIVAEFYLNHPILTAIIPIGLLAWLVVRRLLAHDRRVTLLLLTAGGQFMAVYLPSLVSQFNMLEHRLLFPTTVLCMVLVAYCMTGLRRRWQVAALVMFATLPLFRLPTTVTLSVYDPPERDLWQTIHRDYPDATYFYSDINFVHNLFADMPQRIRWNNEPVPPGVLALSGKDGQYKVGEK